MSEDEGQLVIVNAPHFQAGLVLNWAGVVVRTAPILSYMKDRSMDWVKDYCHEKKWVWGYE